MVLHPGAARPAALLITGSVLLGGCQFMDDGSVTRLQGTGTGAGIGALIGGIAGGRSGALLGSALGAAAGLGLGSLVAGSKQQYVDTEEFYEAQIRRAEEKNLELALYQESLGQQIGDYNREIASLHAQMRAGRADFQAARWTEERLQASYAECVRRLEDGRRELGEQQLVAERLRQAAGGESSRMQRENAQIAALANHVGVLQQQVETMASQSNQLQQFR